MSETIRAAWIGAVCTLAGALITLVAQPILTERLGPKREGIFSVEQTCLSSTNLDPEIAAQVATFPCQLRLAHIEGPAVTVSLTSVHPLEGLTTQRNDEQVNPALSAKATVLSVDVPTLRQGSVIDIRFLSRGEPRIDKNVIRESGSLVTDAPANRKSWFDEWYGVPLLLLGLSVIGVGVAYILYTRVLQPETGPVPPQKLAFGAALVFLSVLPVADLAMQFKLHCC